MFLFFFFFPFSFCGMLCRYIHFLFSISGRGGGGLEGWTTKLGNQTTVG